MRNVERTARRCQVYMLIALAVTILVMTLAWRGISARAAADDQPNSPTRPARPRPTRTLAPDDDPDFLREIDRKLRGEDKSS